MKEGSDSTIFLDKEVIQNAIKENGKYEADGLLVKNWEGDELSESYIVKMQKAGTKFFGVLNKTFDRDGYGIYSYENGEKYFGFFRNDLRNFNGIYIWPGENTSDRTKNECYYGFWKDNKKFKNGIYLWIDESITNPVFDRANFDAYVGEIEEGTYSRGTFMQKKGDDYFLYHGNFTKNGQKNDDNGFYYTASLDRLFHGKIENDVFVEGYVSLFDSGTGMMTNIVKASFDSNANITNFVLDKEMPPEEKEKEVKIHDLFRNVILGKDYFGDVYYKYKKITDFMKESMSYLAVFDDKDKFPMMMKLCVAYNNNIYNDIEEHVYDRKID